MPSEEREETYKENAAACLDMARVTNDRESKLAFLDIARALLVLAEQHEFVQAPAIRSGRH
jgi:hypothetical protein